MIRVCVFILTIIFLHLQHANSEQKQSLINWEDSWWNLPTAPSWSMQNRIPMTTDYDEFSRGKKGKFKVKKKLRQFMMPLLLAYKMKFFTLIPILVGGLLLLTGATGMAGFFFALFAAAMGLKTGYHH